MSAARERRRVDSRRTLRWPGNPDTTYNKKGGPEGPPLRVGNDGVESRIPDPESRYRYSTSPAGGRPSIGSRLRDTRFAAAGVDIERVFDSPSKIELVRARPLSRLLQDLRQTPALTGAKLLASRLIVKDLRERCIA